MYMYADGLGLAVWGSLVLLYAGCFVFWAVNRLFLWRRVHDSVPACSHGVPRLSVKVRLIWPEKAANDGYRTPHAA